MKTILAVRFRIDFDGACSIGRGKIELLEKIAGFGSLSEAARQMGMSYRRAWMLIDSMNLSFDEPVVIASIGGRGGGGAVVTAFGKQLIAAYREMEKELPTVAARHMQRVAGHITANRAKSAKAKTVR